MPDGTARPARLTAQKEPALSRTDGNAASGRTAGLIEVKAGPGGSVRISPVMRLPKDDTSVRGLSAQPAGRAAIIIARPCFEAPASSGHNC